MRVKVLLVALLTLTAMATSARGDWNTGDPYKWLQPPDLSTTGMDVNATAGQAGNPLYVLADDFLCTVTSPITDIHVWGSWRYDYPPFGFDPGAVTFMISIHEDIPAEESPTGYSMPGEVLWMREFGPGDFVVRQWASNLQEWWWGGMEPPVFPGDSICWQYNFFIPIADAFVQQGTTTSPVVYWLSLHARPEDPDPDVAFGWKTSSTHWNDAAVWRLLDEPATEPWRELRYPFPHPLQGQQIDLAFVITEPVGTDWGDAADPPYPTLSGASNGANHTIASGVYLGQTVDSEGDGQPDPNALGDDLAGADDEDGIVFLSPLIPGSPAQLQVQASAAGYLSGWIDFNRDGYWLSSQGDWVLTSQYVPAGTSVLGIAVPVTAMPGIRTFARFRFTTQAWTALPSGPAPDGEVEDYTVFIEHGPTDSKWIQYPDLEQSGMDVHASFDRVLADDFLCTEPGRLTRFRVWGSWLGDRLPFDDETAVLFKLSLHADIPAEESPTGYSMPGELLWERMFGPSGPSGFTVQQWFQTPEGWYDSLTGLYQFPADWTCWLYTFRVVPSQAFHQVGTPEHPVVYWLDVEAFPDDVEAVFGWKTSLDHWNDDAVWATPLNHMWYELRYPLGHPFEGQSIDMAFAVESEYGTGVPGGGEPEQVVPERFGLRQNVPNPFNPVTTIGYDVPAGGGRVTIEVFDVNGRLVRTLVDGVVGEGVRSVVWDGRDAEGKEVGSGVYFCRMKAEGLEQTVKMTLLK
jgi:hypothetical protein